MKRSFFGTKEEFLQSLESAGSCLLYLLGGIFCLFILINIYNSVNALFFSTPYKRTFICNNISFSNQINGAEQYKRSLKSLGVVAEIEFYENALRLTVGEEKKESGIFTKIDDDKYQYWRPDSVTVVLQISSSLGLIESAMLSYYNNDTLEQTFILKRQF